MDEPLTVVTEFEVKIVSDENHYPAYCAAHDCEGNLWSGGLGECWNCLIVETSCNCVLTRVALVSVTPGATVTAEKMLRLHAEWVRHGLHDPEHWGVQDLRAAVASFGRVLAEFDKESWVVREET